MPEQLALHLADLAANTKQTVTLGETKILVIRTEDTPSGSPTLFAVEAECPHAKAPLEKSAVCNGRLVCPWHTGTFELATGTLLEPPPLRDLKRFPIRLDGNNILVDPTPLPTEKPTPTGHNKHLVFAGAGAATAAALAWLRDASFAGTLTVIDPVPEEPVDRTQLTKMALTGTKPLDTLPIFSPPGQETPDSLDALDLVRLQGTVTHLDQPNRTVTVDTGEVVPYDALLLATGSRPRLPKTPGPSASSVAGVILPGADLPHVFTIRHPEDLRHMDPLLTPNARVALIGDSFIAFEAASALRQRGLHTTVLAQSKLPFADKFGEQVAQALIHLHKANGVTLHTEAEVTAISATAVTLSTGADIPADVVIVAIGVEPITDYAPDLPAGGKGGFAVGRNLRLAPNLWCAGDIASVDGTRIEHWRLAQQHGRTAAEAMFAYTTGNAHGPASPFTGVPFFWTFHFGKRLGYAGHADTWDQIHIEGNPQALDFLAFYMKDNTVAAVLGCGRDTAIAALMEPLREPQTLQKLLTITTAATLATQS